MTKVHQEGAGHRWARDGLNAPHVLGVELRGFVSEGACRNHLTLDVRTKARLRRIWRRTNFGTTSLGSFSALFKKRVGATPSAYQREMRTLVAVPAGFRRVFAPGCLSLMGQLPATAFRSFGEA